MLLDLPQGASFGWKALTRIVGLDKLFQQNYAEPDEGQCGGLPHGIAPQPGIHSILHTLCARENCRTMRDVLPRDLWECVNSMYLASRRYSSSSLGRKDRRQMLEEMIYDRHAVSGVLANCMSHDVAYQFIGLGEHLERADMTTRILDIHSAIQLPEQGSGDVESGAAVGGGAQLAFRAADVPPAFCCSRQR